MKSIREIYKIGKGPSSSHTMGPERAAKLFREEHPDADAFKVVLYGSLSKTGVGHGTDTVLRDTLSPLPTEIIFSNETIINRSCLLKLCINKHCLFYSCDCNWSFRNYKWNLNLSPIIFICFRNRNN